MEILTLDRLNHALAAWLEQSYHQQPNSETGQSPLKRYHQGSRLTRHVNLQEVLKYFLHKVRRKVREDFSDVQLDGLFFQVDPRLRATGSRSATIPSVPWKPCSSTPPTASIWV